MYVLWRGVGCVDFQNLGLKLFLQHPKKLGNKTIFNFLLTGSNLIFPNKTTICSFLSIKKNEINSRSTKF